MAGKAPSSTIVLANYGRATLSQRTRASGRQAHTIEIKSAPVAVVVDATLLGVDVAVAMAETIRGQIQDIGEQVKPATRAARRKEARAYVAGEAWAVKRYSGGRTGATPPNIHSTRMFNMSGRLAKSIAVRQRSDGSLVVNCAANRLNPNDFVGGAGGQAYQHMVTELVRLVPAINTPMAQPRVVEMQRKTAQRQNVVGRMGEPGAAVAARATAPMLQHVAKILQFARGAIAA